MDRAQIGDWLIANADAVRIAMDEQSPNKILIKLQARDALREALSGHFSEADIQAACDQCLPLASPAIPFALRLVGYAIGHERCDISEIELFKLITVGQIFDY